MNISIVGQNIKRIRESRGLSAYKLAKLAQVGNTTISEIESGKRQNIKSDTLDKIAAALNVTTDDLLKVENSEEYIVQDIEDALDFLLSSDELTLKGENLTLAEKDLLMVTINEKIDEIIMLRNLFKTSGVDSNKLKTSKDLMYIRNRIIHGNREK
ncbi:MAG: helix-turn-helix transcriptional regulator [Clostridium celatum]|nr:helix-turn-helix transcriptional regulator [Clostridium celatum]